MTSSVITADLLGLDMETPPITNPKGQASFSFLCPQTSSEVGHSPIEAMPVIDAEAGNCSHPVTSETIGAGSSGTVKVPSITSTNNSHDVVHASKPQIPPRPAGFLTRPLLGVIGQNTFFSSAVVENVTENGTA